MLADLAGHISPEVDPRAPERAKTFLERAEAACRTFNEKLWNREKGYFKVCESKDTIFQGGLAGDWIARLAGMRPVVVPERARSHALWQDRVLVEAARGTRLASGKFVGKPLPFNEATPDGEKVRLKMLGFLKLDVNYIYQVISHQAFEAIYLGHVRRGLECIQMIYDKAYEEGYPWEMSLFGLPGFVYMTHPVMWGFFNAMTGAALDLPKRTLYLAPKVFPESTILRLPVFFPLFWLALEYDSVKREGAVRVIKVITRDPQSGGAPGHERNGRITLDRLVLTRSDDTVKELELGGFIVEEGAAFPFSLQNGQPVMTRNLVSE
jgi:hypothetical protein